MVPGSVQVRYEWTGSIFLSHHLPLLGCEVIREAFKPDDLVTSNGLFRQVDMTLAISTGIHTGYVWLTVEIREEAPTFPDPAQWDEVIDADLRWSCRAIQVRTVEDGAVTDFSSMNLREAENYRVRVHAFGRDTAIDGVAYEPIERYLIQLWPGPVAGEVLHKVSDGCGEQLRRRSACG